MFPSKTGHCGGFLYKEKETFNDFLVLQLANLFFSAAVKR